MPSKQKKLNLLPKDEFESTSLGRILKWAISTFRYIVIVVELVVIGSFLSRFWLDRQNASLTEEIIAKKSVIEASQDTENKFRNYQAKLNIFASLTDEKNNSLPIIQFITQALPQDVKLTTVNIKEDNTAQIEADSLSETSISQFIVNLNAGSLLKDTSLVRVEGKPDSPLITFSLKTNLKNLFLEPELENTQAQAR